MAALFSNTHSSRHAGILQEFPLRELLKRESCRRAGAPVRPPDEYNWVRRAVEAPCWVEVLVCFCCYSAAPRLGEPVQTSNRGYSGPTGRSGSCGRYTPLTDVESLGKLLVPNDVMKLLHFGTVFFSSNIAHLGPQVMN
ncbi:hypothetical protein RRG08_038318 [Elysia crispata]|uniref:Uncharacterized protein n=1 Tax=Elysia crispata TaxID=231223 RepID=A0AAE1E2V0_9GAST|nr:hypothetical protein RRG08_038318 [Elysia crispata]